MSLRALLLTASSLIVPAAAAHAAIPEGKLPAGIVQPQAYRLDLKVVPDQERFSGHTEIDLTMKSAQTALYMHGRDLHITRAVAIQGSKEVAATWAQLDPLGVSQITFASPLKAGAVTLKFDYDAPFGDGPEGLYHIKVGDDWYAWTQFESIDARAAFPSFDEPGFKTPFTVSLTTKAGFVTASNAPETGHSDAGDGLVKHTFAPTKPLPTYLVAMVVGPFAVAEGVAPPTPQRKDPLPIRIIATQPNKDKLAYALKETPSIIAHLESYFDMSFPYPKLDQIGSPVMPGAMENAGADIYGDEIIALDENAPTVDKQEFGMVVSHELSHQWFGDYVTPAWWDDIWLNESFANWMGYRIGNEWRPELNIGIGAVSEAYRAMPTDSLKVGRPIHQAITSNSQVDAAFDSITYGKGGQVVAMVAAYLGDDKFREGVRLHMSRHPYGNATSDDFFGALADAAKDPRVLAAMKSFVNQQGLPVVHITHDGDKLVATQERYARLGTQLPAQTWTIPLCVRHGDTRTCTLMDKTSQTVAAPGTGAVMPNAGGTGYYRFTLDDADWDALIATGPKLSAGEGLAATDSLWAEFYAGKGKASQLIDAARSFANNPDSNVAVDGGHRLAALHTLAGGDAVQADYRRIMDEIYKPRLDALGFDPKSGLYLSEDPDRQKLRQAVVGLVADDAHDDATRARLKTAAAAYLGGDQTALDPAFRGTALDIYVEDGGQTGDTLATAKDMYERFLASHDESFRSEALGAVTAGADSDRATWLFGQFDDKRLRTPDKLRLLSGLFNSDATRDQAYTWLKANYDAFSASAGIFTAGRIASLPSSYCSAARADEIDSIMRPKVKAAGRGELSFDRMLETMRDCGALKDARGAEAAKALHDAK